MKLPTSTHSALVVRISVTFELCSKSFRSVKAAGIVVLGPKLTISAAPSDMMFGMPLRRAASSLFGPALQQPPTTWSQISVVVMSSTASS